MSAIFGFCGGLSFDWCRPQLRDIFRVDPNTPCNTHDLLGCPCEGTAMAVPSDSALAEDSDVHDIVQQGFMKACELKPETAEKMDRAVKCPFTRLKLISLADHVNFSTSRGRKRRWPL